MEGCAIRASRLPGLTVADAGATPEGVPSPLEVVAGLLERVSAVLVD